MAPSALSGLGTRHSSPPTQSLTAGFSLVASWERLTQLGVAAREQQVGGEGAGARDGIGEADVDEDARAEAAPVGAVEARAAAEIAQRHWRHRPFRGRALARWRRAGEAARPRHDVAAFEVLKVRLDALVVARGRLELCRRGDRSERLALRAQPVALGHREERPLEALEMVGRVVLVPSHNRMSLPMTSSPEPHSKQMAVSVVWLSSERRAASHFSLASRAASAFAIAAVDLGFGASSAWRPACWPWPPSRPPAAARAPRGPERLPEIRPLA